MSKKNLTQEEFERIERYLRSEMTDSERIAFEKSMALDEELSGAVDQLQIEVSAIEESSFRESLNEFHSNIQDQNDGKVFSIQQPKRTSFPKWAIAASVAFLIGLGVYFSQQAPSHEKLFAEHFSPDPGLSTPMSSTDNYEFYRGMVDYKQGEYLLALDRWNKLSVKKSPNDTLAFYLGVTHLATSSADSAKYYLKQVDRNNKAFGSESLYFLGLTELKIGNLDDAIKSFEMSGKVQSLEILRELRR